MTRALIAACLSCVASTPPPTADVAATRPAGPDELAGFERSAVFLIRDRAVLAELGAGATQVAALRKAADEIDEKLWLLRDVPPEMCADQLIAAAVRTNEAVVRILDAAQQARLQQIVLRAQGVAGLLRPDTAERLSLTADQQRKARDLWKSIREARQTLDAANRTGTRRDDVERFRQRLRTQEREWIATNLDATQRETWRNLLGDPFDVSRIRPPSFKAPDIRGATEWVSGEPLTLARLRGQVVVLHFWTFGCINCIRNYPTYKRWQEAYAGKPVTILGVHTPETPGERDAETVRRKAVENGLRFPTAIDNDRRIWDAWGNRVWPSAYLIDRRGYVRYWWYGEFHYNGQIGETLMREKIDELLREQD